MNQTKMSAADYVAELKRRQQDSKTEYRNLLNYRAEESKRIIREELPSDVLFSISYCPFVIAEIAWDYVDTIFNMTQLLGLEQTKKLSRFIQTLRKEYDIKRFQTINSIYRERETENMLDIEDMFKDFFNRCHKKFREAFTECYGTIEPNNLMLLTSVYVCHTVLQALFKYCDAQQKVFSAAVGYETVSILPEELRKLDNIILEYAGNLRLPDSKRILVKLLSDEFAGYLNDIEFVQ